MNKDSWIALIIAIIITVIASTPLYYSRDYSRGSQGKFSEGSEPMKRTGQIPESPTESTMPWLKHI